MSLPRFSLNNPRVIIALVGVLTLLGVQQFMSMPRRADPAFTLRVCQVITRWDGIRAERVEELIARPLEEAISELAEVDYVRSVTTTGQTALYVNLEGTLAVDKIEQTWDKVRAKVDTVRLPPGATRPIIYDDFGDTAVMLLAIYEKQRVVPDDGAAAAEPQYTKRDLEVLADRVRDAIALVPGVARAQTHGAHQEAIYIETTAGAWANLDLTISQLEDLLAARNVELSGGSIDTDQSRFNISPSGSFDTVEQVRHIAVGRHTNGAPVYLKDLGLTVRRGYQDPPGAVARYGNAQGHAPTVVVSFTMKDGEKVTDIGPAVRAILSDMQEKDKVIPPDIEVEVVFDESVFVDKKISDFITNVLQAVGIVLAVALIMSGLASSMVMAAAVPFVMIITLGLVAMMGIELEQMSIASLIIALGLLVDNAVVVTDNVRRFQALGHSRRESVARGVEQIMFPILIGTLTTVFAFLPLAFALSAERAEYIFSIPVVVSVTLLTSWVLALSQTSLMCYLLIKPRKDGSQSVAPLTRIGRQLSGLLTKLSRGGKQNASKADENSAADETSTSTTVPSSEDAVSENAKAMGIYPRLLNVLLRAKSLAIAAVVALLVGAASLPVGSEFFPDDVRDYLYIDVWLPEGSSWQATDDTARRVEDILREVSPIDVEGIRVERLGRYYTSVGGSGARFALGVNPQPPAPNFAQIIVQTTDALLTDNYVNELKQAFRQNIAKARITASKLSLGPPTDSPIGIRLYGEGYSRPGFADEARLRGAAEELKQVFASVEGLTDIHDEWGLKGYSLDVEIDDVRANLVGVTNASVGKTLNAYYSGHQLTMFREGDHLVPVYLRLPRTDRQSLIDPRRVHIEGANDKVPLTSVAKVEHRRTASKIERRDMNRMIEVRADVSKGLLANERFSVLLPRVEAWAKTLPPGYRFEVGGTAEQTIESSGEMMIAFGIGVVLIVLTLVVQYNSFVKPLIILMTVPLGAIGALLGLYLSGNALGFMPMLGLVALSGIVVNAGILFLEFADESIRSRLAKKEGLAGDGERSCNGLTIEAFHQCLMEAGRARLLPITLTVSTTVGGLLPLALVGGPLWEGMAWMLIVGLIVATTLTLLLLPVFYAVCVQTFGMNLVNLPESD